MTKANSYIMTEQCANDRNEKIKILLMKLFYLKKINIFIYK